MKKLASIMNLRLKGFRLSIKERYILLIACLLLIVPFARIIQDEYSNPHKKVYRVPKMQFTSALNQLKDARVRRNSDELIASLIRLSRLYSKDEDSFQAAMILKSVLEDEVETTQQRVDVLTALGDVYRDQKDEEGLKLAHKNYLEAIKEAEKLDNKELSARLQIKLINLCYIKGSDDFAREADRIAALNEAQSAIKSARTLAEDVNSKKLLTAIHNYSTMIELEAKRLGLSDKQKSW